MRKLDVKEIAVLEFLDGSINRPAKPEVMVRQYEYLLAMEGYGLMKELYESVKKRLEEIEPTQQGVPDVQR